jgi:hypothetical protein
VAETAWSVPSVVKPHPSPRDFEFDDKGNRRALFIGLAKVKKEVGETNVRVNTAGIKRDGVR